MTTYTKVTMTYHARVERLDRLAACVEYLGMGDIVLEVAFNNRRFKLTSTGICLVCDLHEDILITGYMCPVERCRAMYHAGGYDRVPPAIYHRVRRNCERYRFLSEM